MSTSNLGKARTRDFSIGVAEVRVGPLNLANKLLPEHSVGLVDDATISVSQESVDLMGGFPRRMVDTAIISQESTMTATLREYSRRNIRLLLGEGVEGSTPTAWDSTLAALATAAATSVSVPNAAGAGLAENDLVVIYPVGKPEEVTVAKVLSVTPGGGTDPDVIALQTYTPLLHNYAIGAIIKKVSPVAIGGVAETKYFSASIIQRKNSDGSPIVFNFWKAAIGSGMEYGTSAEDFASTELQLKFLEPAAEEYGVGEALAHLATIIPDYPTGMFIAG